VGDREFLIKNGFLVNEEALDNREIKNIIFWSCCIRFGNRSKNWKAYNYCVVFNLFTAFIKYY